MKFGAGSAETLREWLAVSGKKRGLKRKADDDAEQKEHEEGKAEGQASEEEQECGDYDLSQDDCNQPQLYSPLLLFLHSLAAKPSFVHLELHHCHITPFVMDHMPVWPYLLCFSVADNFALEDYPFANAATRYPSLTSLASPCCSDAAIEQLSRLPKLEELRFPECSTWYDTTKTENTLRAISKVTSLRSVQYTPNGDGDRHDEPPSLAALTPLVTLAHLTRLTLHARWLPEDVSVQLFTRHHFVYLRCLELIEQDVWFPEDCPQNDAALLPLVKPAGIVVAGREGRQAARAVKRRDKQVDEEVDDDGDGTPLDIPADYGANFPALECLALPYCFYSVGTEEGDGDIGYVSAWMKQQLRRSYEYEVAVEWEAETSTLGEAELLKRI